MLLLGIDIGTSSVKVTVVDALTHRTVGAAHWPEEEAPIIRKESGWAEQSPESWWQYLQGAMRRLVAAGGFDPGGIGAIGIAYQMHGLVLVDKDDQLLRDSIIWCDSRAVPIGEKAMADLGEAFCYSRLLNSPGNFTAAKLAWVKKFEPEIYARISKVLLPGDYMALRLTGQATTTVEALSEGTFWDFSADTLSSELFSYFGFSEGLIPEIRPVFSEHGRLQAEAAALLGLRPGIPVTYKAGDQPNNALALNVLEPGECAATAGTSGVIYAVSDQLITDPSGRVNSFAHVTDQAEQRRIGVLLCINGAGILNHWIRDLGGKGANYAGLNAAAAGIPAGSEGLFVLPFGNGAERILQNRLVGGQIRGIDLNKHSPAHLYRAGQEGIAFAFRYGLDILRSIGMDPRVIRAARTNMFLSPVFAEAFVQVTGVPVELYDTDGSTGAALGAGIGAGIFATGQEAFAGRKPLETIVPAMGGADYEALYDCWKEIVLTTI